MAAGRPPFEITPKIIQQVEALAAQGLTDEEISLVIGCANSTLSLKKKQFSEFSDAIKRGKAKGIATISNALFQNAKAGDNTSMIFYLKCQAKWRDTQHIDLGGNVGHTDKTLEALDARIAELAGKLAKPTKARKS